MVNEGYFKTWNANSAYVVGFILADGCVHHYGNCIKIDLRPADREILDFISAEVTPNYRLRLTKRKTEIRWCPSSKILKEDLIALGITPKKTGLERIPPGLPAEFFWDFLKGYFDGDGHITGESIQITCNSKSFLTTICKTIGMGKVYKDRMNFRLCIQNKDEIKRFSDNLYKNGYVLRRKYDRMMLISTYVAKRNGRFSKDEDAFLRANRNEFTRLDLALQLGRTPSSIHNRLTKLKIIKS